MPDVCERFYDCQDEGFQHCEPTCPTWVKESEVGHDHQRCACGKAHPGCPLCADALRARQERLQLHLYETRPTWLSDGGDLRYDLLARAVMTFEEADRG